MTVSFQSRFDPTTTHARSLKRIVIAVAVSLTLAIVGFEIWTAWLAREGQLTETQTKVANLSSLVAEHAERSIEAADIVLRGVIDSVAAGGMSAIDVAQQRIVLSRRAAELAQVLEITVLDVEGHVVVSSRQGSLDPSAVDSEYFRFHRDHPNAGLHISGPVTGLARGRSVFIASRALMAPDGSFAGVASAALQTQFYQDFYDALDVGQNGSILLSIDDGTILVRHPYAAAYVGRSIAQSDPIFARYLPQSPSGAARVISSIDGVERWNAFKHLQNSNLVVDAALSEHEELSEWRSQTTDQSIAILSILIMIFGSCAYLVRQIDRRAEAEHAAAANAAQYKLLADNSTDVILRIGLDGVRKYASPSSKSVLGYEPEEMIAQKATAFTHPEDRKLVLAAWERIRNGSGTQIATSRVRHKNGQTLWVETIINGVQDPQTGEVVELVASMREVSTRKAIEARLIDAVRELATARDASEQAARAKSQFLAAMSHEIRTPLNAVIGFAELMQKTAPTEDYRRYAELQLDAGNSLLKIINDILDFSRLEAGTLALHQSDVDLVRLIESCEDMHQASARGKGLDLRVSIAPDLPRRVNTDRARLRQILGNLLSNAIKFSRSGTVSLIARRAGTDASPMLSIAVSDTGIGIPEEKLGLLFQRFSQLDAAIDREFGGTGLGLAISQLLARQMGGEITVESKVEAGSTFTLDLPLHLAQSLEREAPRPVVAEQADPRLALSILVAEDDKANQRLISALLAEAGCTVEIVDNGEAAVDAVAKRRYDLVLMDVAMPLMDGFQAAERIRSIAGDSGRVPIIALTAHVLPGDAERCAAAGMQGHVGKPINRRELLVAIAANARASIAAAS